MMLQNNCDASIASLGGVLVLQGSWRLSCDFHVITDLQADGYILIVQSFTLLDH